MRRGAGGNGARTGGPPRDFPQPAGGALKAARRTRREASVAARNPLLVAVAAAASVNSCLPPGLKNAPETPKNPPDNVRKSWRRGRPACRVGSAVICATVIFSTHGARRIGPRAWGAGPSPRVGDGVGDPQTRRCFFPSSAAPLRHRVLRLLWRIVLRSGSEKALQNQLCCGVAAAAGGEVR